MVVLAGLTQVAASHASRARLPFWAVALDFLLLVAMCTLVVLLARDRRSSSDHSG